MDWFYRRRVKGWLQTGEFLMNDLWDFEEIRAGIESKRMPSANIPRTK